MNKKKIIIISIAVIICFSIIGVSAFILNPARNENETNILNENNTSVSKNDNVNVFNGLDDRVPYNTTVQDTTDEPIEHNDVEQDQDNIYDSTTYWKGERLPNFVDGERITHDSGAKANAYTSDDMVIEHINQEQYKQNACDFLWNFSTYNTDTVNNGQYIAGFARFVDAGAIPSSSIIAQHMNRKWLSAAATYPELLSYAVSIECYDPYISHIGNTDGQVAVRLTMIVIRNQDEPGMFEWEMKHKFKESWAVYFDSNGKIVNAKMQTSDIIEMYVN